MASSGPHRRRNSIDLPPTLADVFRLRDDFIELYGIDHPQLQQCLMKLQEIIKTFEKDFRGSTEGSRVAGWWGIAGGSAVAAGLVGLTASPFTLGLSVPICVGLAGAGVAAGGIGTLRHARFLSNKSSSEKKDQMDRLRKYIESELKEFQAKINPMAEKMTDLHECTEKIMTDFKNLEKEGSDLVQMQIEELAELTEQMSENMRLITSVAQIYGGVNLVLDIISVREHGRALNDMNKLAEKPIHEELDERKIKSKAGKFIVEMRKFINQLKNIIDELEKTKQKLGDNLRNKT